MIVTYEMDLAGRMNMEPMLEAAKLGAIVECDSRKVLNEGALRADVIRKLGPNAASFQNFGQRTTAREGRLYSKGAFAKAMRARGFTNHELDLISEQNPAQLLRLSKQ